MEHLIVLINREWAIQVYIFLDIIDQSDNVKVQALLKNQPHFIIKVMVQEEILIF